jgi:hypothetical protein
MKQTLSFLLALSALGGSGCSDSAKKAPSGDPCQTGSEDCPSDDVTDDATGDDGESGGKPDATVKRDAAGLRDSAIVKADPPSTATDSGLTVSDSAQSGADAGGSSVTGAVGGLEPIIPEINGECPAIKEGNSTISIMGLRATVIAGAKKEGTGSLLVYYYGTGKLGGVSSLPSAIKTDITSQGGIVFALNEAKNTGGDCSGTGTFGIDDFKVVDQFVACAVKNYGINPKRIYATGCSAGGLTAGCMGIMRSNYLAGAAPNSGGVTIGYGKLQDPQRVPNVITMNGGAADNVIVNFGQTSEGYDNYILKYGGFAVNCIHSSGHCGAPSSLYQSAWQFLKDHPYGTKPSPYAGGLPSGFHPSCKVFTMTDRAPIGGY